MSRGPEIVYQRMRPFRALAHDARVEDLVGTILNSTRADAAHIIRVLPLFESYYLSGLLEEWIVEGKHLMVTQILDRMDEDQRIRFAFRWGIYSVDSTFTSGAIIITYQKLFYTRSCPHKTDRRIFINGAARWGGEETLYEEIESCLAERIIEPSYLNVVLVHAAAGNRWDIILELNRRYQNLSFQPSLERAAAAGHLELVKGLITLGADNLAIAIKYAASTGQREVVRYLRSIF